MAAFLATVQGVLHGPVTLLPERDAWALEANAAIGLEGALWVDARPMSAFATGHYPGAVHLDPGNWDEGLGELLVQWEPDQPIIVYCDRASCSDSRDIASQLREELGGTPVYWVVGGWQQLRERQAP